MKTCTTCNTEKDDSCFDNIKNIKTCKSCRKEISHLFYLKNKEKILQRNKLWKIKNEDYYVQQRTQYRIENKEKINKKTSDKYYENIGVERERSRKKHLKFKVAYNKKQKEYRNKNKEKIKNYSKEYYAKNKILIHEKARISRQVNKEKLSHQYKKYRSTEKMKSWYNEYVKTRYKNEPDYRLMAVLRDRIRMALRKNTKGESTKKLIGCTIEFLKSHLQKTAMQNGYMEFDINNYSGREYHIDHIIPCDSFDLSNIENQKKCFHYSNMQILDSRTNVIKSNKLAA